MASTGPEAAIHFTAAAGLWGPGHRRFHLRARWAAADASLTSDPVAAAAELIALEQECLDVGYLPHLGRVRRSLRAVGVRRAVRSAPAGGALTPRERETLELAADGLTSTQIALRLGVARSTVETQLASGLRRLGVRTRREAAVALEESR